jgi:hypothetical protein
MQFAGTCGPIGRIAILVRSEYEYRDAEYEYGASAKAARK